MLPTIENARKQAEQMLERDPFLEARTLNQFGLAQIKLGMVQESVDCIRQSSDMYETSGNFREVDKAYLNLVMSYRKLQDFEKSAHYSEKDGIIFEALEDLLDGIRLQVTHAVLRAKEGRLAEAVAMLEEASGEPPPPFSSESSPSSASPSKS